jgi:hypothetical protein
VLTNGTSEAVACSAGVPRSRRLDVESQAWIDRRRAAFPHLRGNDYDDLAQQAPDDA